MASNSQRIQFLVSQENGFNRSRLPALYSDFRGLRSTNPEGYAANVAAWRRALASLVRNGLLPAGSAFATSSKPASSANTSTAARNFLVLTAGQQLLDALQSDRYGRPLALDAVIREAVQDRDLVPVPAFIRSRESIYNRRSWAAWAAMPWSVLSWGLHQLGVIDGTGESGATGRSSALTGAGGRLASEQFVVLANVEAAASSFAEKTADLRTPFERIWSAAHFRRLFSQPGAIIEEALPQLAQMQTDTQLPRLSETDLEVLLVFLSRDKNLVVYDGQVVKLRAAGDGNGGNNFNAIITEEDRAVAQLRELIESLNHQTSVLCHRIDDLTVAAHDALIVRKNRVAAQVALRQKKQAETALAARYATLEQLDATAAKIQQAADNVQVVQAMEASAGALASLNAQVGGAERVEDVVDKLRDQMEATDEIGQILADSAPVSTALGTGSANAVIDEGEIEDELAALEKQEAEKKERAEALLAVEKLKQQQAARAEVDRLAAETTKQRLESIGQVPVAVGAPGQLQTQTPTQSEADALEAETTESMSKLKLENEPQLAV